MNTDLFRQLLAESSTLRGRVQTDLTLPSPEDIEDRITERKEFRVKIKEARNQIADKIDELRAWSRTLGTESDWQGTDIEKLTSQKWEMIHERKQV